MYFANYMIVNSPLQAQAALLRRKESPIPSEEEANWIRGDLNGATKREISVPAGNRTGPLSF